jgi:hypothetical protein
MLRARDLTAKDVHHGEQRTRKEEIFFRQRTRDLTAKDVHHGEFATANKESAKKILFGQRD